MKVLNLLIAMCCFCSLAQAASSLPSSFLKQRDPFKKPQFSVQAEGSLSELELFPVEKFKMLGVMTGSDHLRAMLAAPNGKTYFVQEKMNIGNRKGVIRKITDNAVTVREKIVNVLGQEELIDSEITLPPAEQQDVKQVTNQKGW